MYDMYAKLRDTPKEAQTRSPSNIVVGVNGRPLDDTRSERGRGGGGGRGVGGVTDPTALAASSSSLSSE